MFVLLCIILKNNRGNATVYREQFHFYSKRYQSYRNCGKISVFVMQMCFNSIHIILFVRKCMKLWHAYYCMGLYENISENAIDNRVVCTACFSSDTKGWEICFLCYSLSHSLLCVNIVEQNKTFGLACCHNNVYLEPCLYAIN